MYVPSRVAARRLGVHPNTLRRWADEGKIEAIRTESGQRRYDVDAYLGKHSRLRTVCYCRVSSYKQKDDLERQVEFMRKRYPEAEIVKDVASGLNFRRKGLKAILESALGGDRIELVVAHRDRLARFGFDLIEWIIERSGGRVVVLDKTELSPEQELTKDLLSILHVFSARLHGLRSYKDQVKQALSDKGATKDSA
jgi:excisionase family DNA binding protein